MNWTTFLLSLVSAITVAVLTSFLAPRFQHSIWKKQKFSEQRISVAERLGALNAAFRFEADDGSDPNWGNVWEMDGLLRLVEILFERQETRKAAADLKSWIDNHGIKLTGEIPITDFMELWKLRVELLACLYSEAFLR